MVDEDYKLEERKYDFEDSEVPSDWYIFAISTNDRVDVVTFDSGERLRTTGWISAGVIMHPYLIGESEVEAEVYVDSASGGENNYGVGIVVRDDWIHLEDASTETLCAVGLWGQVNDRSIRYWKSGDGDTGTDTGEDWDLDHWYRIIIKGNKVTRKYHFTVEELDETEVASGSDIDFWQGTNKPVVKYIGVDLGSDQSESDYIYVDNVKIRTKPHDGDVLRIQGIDSGEGDFDWKQNGAINFKVSEDNVNYLKLTTAAGIPHISTAGSCDLHVDPTGNLHLNPSGDIDANSNKIKNLAAPTLANDAARKQDVDARAKAQAGTYTGDGSTSQKITTGFRPALVIIHKYTGTDDSNDAESITVNDAGRKDGVQLTGDKDYWRPNNVTIVSDGFEVSDQGGDDFPNKLDENYNYVAIG